MRPIKTPIVAIHDLSFGFDGEQACIHHLSHAIAPGLTVVCGEEGSGKTHVHAVQRNQTQGLDRRGIRFWC